MVYCTSSFSIKTICLLLIVTILTTNAQNTTNTRCPFEYLYHLGDGVFDNGNAIAHVPLGPGLPAATLPYGTTHPEDLATGRWCDGLLDIDYGAQGLGFSEITAYLAPNSSSANAIMFAVARSPVLDNTFFRARGIRIPPYTASLRVQMNWFRRYLNTSSTSASDRRNRIVNSLFLFGDVEGNDITYALLQGRSVHQVKGYITYITNAQIDAAREVIRMGATRVIIPGNAPMGCYPFILTGLPSNRSSDYDDIGCLKSVNNLMVLKNNDLQQGIRILQREFPNIFINYADFYHTELALIRETFFEHGNIALQACCGVGGRYNYNSRRFCGSQGVPVCSNPNDYFFWDGIHLTQEGNNRLSAVLADAALPNLGCTA